MIDTGGRDTTTVAERIRALIGASATVTDIADTRGAVGSSLTAVNMAGLTRIELVFGLCLAAAAGALALECGWLNGDAPSRSPMRLAQRAIN